ncbi:hypothetical protein GCM10010109_58610 [Actinoplanes campanulatus]|nr:hypothetical protein GCM10010109_58610 [Actinoplanes campanulatus]GID38846.1 hypothetical protein Aca09nite_53520 [Actinoplanes campanulatus]
MAVSTGWASAAETVPASAARPLPVTTVSDVLVDPVHRHILITDHENGRLVVTNYGGTVLGIREGLAGIRGLALSSDSSTLYAARTDAHAILAFDAATVVQKASYPLGDSVHPYNLAVAGGKVWFGYMGPWAEGGFDGNFGSLDVDGSQPDVHLHDQSTDGSDFYLAPFVTSSPAAPGTLVVSDVSHSGTEAATAAAYDVSGETESRISFGTVVDSYTNEAVLSADGTNLLSAGFGVWSSPLSGLGTRNLITEDTTPAVSLDLAADGRLAVGESNGMYEPEVVVYPAGSRKPEVSYDLPQIEPTTMPMADRVFWEPDGRLFVISRNNQYNLWQLAGPKFPAPTITVDAPATAVRAQALTVTGSVGGAVSLPEGTELSVTRTDVESSNGKVLAKAKIDAAGTFRFNDTPPAGGPVKYTVSYAGSEQADAATGQDTVQIPRATPALSLTGHGMVSIDGQTVTVTATLGTTHTNRIVQFTTQRAGDTYVNPGDPVKVNSAGKATFKVTLSRNTTVTVKFAGDGRYAPRAVSSVLYAKVKAGTGVYNQYKKKVVGSQLWSYFRTSADPKFVHVVTPYPNRTVRTVVQYHSGGKWKTWRTYTTKLTGTGKATVVVPGNYKAGVKWRARAEYLYGTSGDKVNYSTVGDWRYYTFTK